MNSWGAFFNNPKCVFGLIAALVAIWLLFHQQVIADTINNVIMPLLIQILGIAIMIWAIKFLVCGPKKKGGK